ncbi:MAG: LacI family DNA-binding transcriptional regulator [Actinomycetota bacterium]|nr:LacI family DNA-binding transcriptional regulator [Actinomycetota bacterium]
MVKKKKYSIYDIAKKAGVGIGTVSRVLNKSKLVKPETRENILKIIEKLDYQPNFFARNLVKKNSKTIGLLIPEIINPVFSEMAKGIGDKAFEKNYTVFLGNTDSDVEKESKFVKNLLEKHVDGIIFISTEMSKYKGDFEHYLYLYKKNIPIVFINGFLVDVDIPYVRIDEKKAGYLAAKHLLKKGLKKIAFLGGPMNFIPTKEKLIGFRKAFKEYDAKINKKYIILGNFDMESRHNNIAKLVESKDRPEGIITANDIMAIEVIKAAHSKNIKIPDSLEVIGFDNIELSSDYIPSITTVGQPKYEMGSRAFKLLISIIEKKNISSHKIIVEPQLVIRDSSP